MSTIAHRGTQCDDEWLGSMVGSPKCYHSQSVLIGVTFLLVMMKIQLALL